MLKKIKKLLNNPLNGLEKRDILLSSFPKTGSTYTRFVLANVVNLRMKVHENVNFYNLGEILPECKINNLATFEWADDLLPRFVKTHDFKSDNSKYELPKVLYILRDPRDTMISYYNYATKKKSNRFSGNFAEFIEDSSFGIDAYNKHINEWYDKAHWIFKYEDLMTEPHILFNNFFQELLGNQNDEELIKIAVNNSSADKMKKVEVSSSRPNHDVNFDKDFKFVRDASIAQWKNELSKDVSNHIWERSSNILKAIYSKDG